LDKLAAALSGARWTWRGREAGGLARPFWMRGNSFSNAGRRSVSPFAGALAAALGQMVAAFAKKKSKPDLPDRSRRLWTKCEELQMTFEAIDRDAASYEAVMAAFKLRKGR